MMDEVKRLEDHARRCLRMQLFDPGCDAMREAQELWNPALGVAKPAFSSDELRQIEVGKVQTLENLARLFLRNQFFDAAQNAMERAQVHWSIGIGIPRPGFSTNEQSRIQTPSFGEGLKSRKALDRLERRVVISMDNCAICIDIMAPGQMEVLGECGHRFHESCICEWLMQRNACPLCRNPWLQDLA
ncbi:uncharacterized protein AKAW2_50128A [Aspergillus luchuensis]|uniref:RING-type domain-containing protein n=1 Tax=Aspergillus kawachii TaxID=1069201 RepID=A0A7R7ZZY8_ASPKA|nr:uncharacterized protein AKAW2_50128A [Aspergillus luchuensis]BCR99786.1 hypothetical protein AKAW2_50128A [Aspergillus luchuensis]